MLKKLKAGDEVMTNGGIYGEIVKLTDAKVAVKIADKVTIWVSRSAIAGVINPTVEEVNAAEAAEEKK